MAKRLTTILLTTFILSAIITTIVMAIMFAQEPSDTNKNPYISGMAYGIAWMIIISIAIFTTTIYLNLYKKIRNNYFYSALTFLSFPLFIMISFITSLGGFAQGWKMYGAISLPYFFILIFHFLKYRKYLKHMPLV